MIEETVLSERNLFLRHYRLEDTYGDSGFVLHFGRIKVRTANPGLLHVHDLHHVATGFGSGLVGEAEISAFELRAGWGTPFILMLCLGAMSIGMVLSPPRVIRAWRASRGARSLYRADIPYARLLEMPVSELRQFMALPPEGLVPAVWREEERR